MYFVKEVNHSSAVLDAKRFGHAGNMGIDWRSLYTRWKFALKVAIVRENDALAEM